ncbi:MAG TPA: hypothetical protein VFH30_14300 [Acidimicrobiales bacterium]|nr:hypothetical protein [Acidimicrobiales bacterium]
MGSSLPTTVSPAGQGADREERAGEEERDDGDGWQRPDVFLLREQSFVLILENAILGGGRRGSQGGPLGAAMDRTDYT